MSSVGNRNDPQIPSQPQEPSARAASTQAPSAQTSNTMSSMGTVSTNTPALANRVTSAFHTLAALHRSVPSYHQPSIEMQDRMTKASAHARASQLRDRYIGQTSNPVAQEALRFCASLVGGHSILGDIAPRASSSRGCGEINAMMTSIQNETDSDKIRQIKARFIEATLRLVHQSRIELASQPPSARRDAALAFLTVYEDVFRRTEGRSPALLAALNKMVIRYHNTLVDDIEELTTQLRLAASQEPAVPGAPTPAAAPAAASARAAASAPERAPDRAQAPPSQFDPQRRIRQEHKNMYRAEDALIRNLSRGREAPSDFNAVLTRYRALRSADERESMIRYLFDSVNEISDEHVKAQVYAKMTGFVSRLLNR